MANARFFADAGPQAMLAEVAAPSAASKRHCAVPDRSGHRAEAGLSMERGSTVAAGHEGPVKAEEGAASKDADAYPPPAACSCFWTFSRLNEPGVWLGGYSFIDNRNLVA
mgnify:CR=1 FL=1